MAANYAGDLKPADAWAKLESDASVHLIDVRTQAEWNFVGVPDLSGIGRDVHFIQWQKFPSGLVNTEFVEEVKDKIADPKTPILFLCRSGGRSAAAAAAMTDAGYVNCFNVAEGFEGDKDGTGHRSTLGGWRFAGLPWNQG
ncbi:MAG: rhodanese-like domain-containing protein [Rhodospirillales bacterium]